MITSKKDRRAQRPGRSPLFAALAYSASLVAVAGSTVVSCSDAGPGRSGIQSGSGNGGNASGAAPAVGVGFGVGGLQGTGAVLGQGGASCGSNCVIDQPATPGCGDGVLTPDEACDDGNLVADDGCSANCLQVGPGYSCHPAGQLCHLIARCGDGVVSPSELCDDGNLLPGDGCSDRCKMEDGYNCLGSPSSCLPTNCGDGNPEGTESCDDGNSFPYDGCSPDCKAEPSCNGGPCVSECGDGLLLGEECDDGNNNDGDGCSSTCTEEPGFICQQVVPPCEQIGGQCVLRIPVLFRDFSEQHVDFGFGNDGAAWLACDAPMEVAGLVAPMLNAQGKPELAGTPPANVCITSPLGISEWYTDGAGRTTVAGELVLFDNLLGGFVNRYGANGEQFVGRDINSQHLAWCGAAGSACADANATDPRCAMPPAGAQCFDPCSTAVGQQDTMSACVATIANNLFDGNPLFFPVDGVGMETGLAKVPEQYGYNGWPWEYDAFGLPEGTPPHNFSFTTEVRYWFQFTAGTSSTLEFSGDDDVWVFVNGILAVDLGGIHIPLDGSVTLDDTTAATYGLVDGQVYEITVFHAERKAQGSSFKLTLEGFQASRTECEPICGDGIVSLGEECDDIANDGGYGECAPGCVLGPYCGDNIVQEGEDCDDGNRFDGDACGSACRDLIVE